ncbi:MAG: HAD family hydrolase [Candidatus Aenigmarchaeota archaeon]|nr:HAD family hydrolase [Candidatus Aenigmarchaeota archaeon]
MIKAVIFDFGNVIVETKDSKLKKILKKYGLNEKVYRKGHKVYKLYSLGLFKNDKEYLDVYSKILKLKNPLKPKFIDELLKETFDVRPSTVNLLKKLKKRYKIVLATNFVESWVKKVLKNLGIAKFFDLLVVSSKIKVRKPNPLFFHHIIKKLKLKPEECLFISDELNEDLSGAKVIGMKTVWLKKKKEIMTFKPDFVIDELRQILRILG